MSVSLFVSVRVWIFFIFFLKQPCQGACQHSALTRRTHGALSPLSDESLKAVQHSASWWNAFCKVLNYRQKRRGKILKTSLLVLFFFYFSFFSPLLQLLWSPSRSGWQVVLYYIAVLLLLLLLLITRGPHAKMILHRCHFWSSHPESLPFFGASPWSFGASELYWWPQDAGFKHPIIRMVWRTKETLKAFLLSGWNEKLLQSRAVFVSFLLYSTENVIRSFFIFFFFAYKDVLLKMTWCKSRNRTQKSQSWCILGLQLEPPPLESCSSFPSAGGMLSMVTVSKRRWQWRSGILFFGDILLRPDTISVSITAAWRGWADGGMSAADLSSAIDVPAGVCVPISNFKTRHFDKLYSLAPIKPGRLLQGGQQSRLSIWRRPTFSASVYWNAVPTAVRPELSDELTARRQISTRLPLVSIKESTGEEGKKRELNFTINKSFVWALVCWSL